MAWSRIRGAQWKGSEDRSTVPVEQQARPRLAFIGAMETRCRSMTLLKVENRTVQ